MYFHVLFPLLEGFVCESLDLCQEMYPWPRSIPGNFVCKRMRASRLGFIFGSGEPTEVGDRELVLELFLFCWC